MSMDAVKFMKERNRMCKASGACAGCALRDKATGLCPKWCFEHPEEAVAAVEKWAEEHPIKTRQSEFLKQWPNASADEDGVLFCPKTVDSAHICYCKDKGCVVCRREFWLQEVE